MVVFRGVFLMSLIVAALFLSAQAAAAPESTVPAPVAAPVPAPKVKQKKICKTEEAESGSHMSKRVCLTEEQWAQRSGGMTDSARSGFSGTAQDH